MKSYKQFGWGGGGGAGDFGRLAEEVVMDHFKLLKRHTLYLLLLGK